MRVVHVRARTHTAVLWEEFVSLILFQVRPRTHPPQLSLSVPTALPGLASQPTALL